MKKIILTAAAIFAFGFANAQDKKEASGEGFANGDVFVSGGFGFGSDKTGDFKESAFKIAPAVGFFVADDIAVGARISLITLTESQPNTPDDKTNVLNTEVFGRYYLTPSSKFSTFGELAVGFGSRKDEQGNASTTSKTFGVNAGIGFNYFLTSNWSIEAGWAGLGFNSDDNGGNGAEKTSSFGLNVDLSAINFGLNYKF